MKTGKPLILIVMILVSAFGLFYAVPAFPFLPQFTKPSSGTAAADHWDFTSFSVVWNLNPSFGSNIQGTRSLSEVIASSFGAWTGAPNATVIINQGANTSQTSAGFTQSSPNNTNLICFVCSGDFSKDTQTLAVSITTTATATGQADGHGGTTRFVGQLLDADILFNPADSFSNDGVAAGQDLQTIATHEIGHFLGLDHSAIVRSVMFPFAPSVLQSLSYDDVAGLSNLYPSGSPTVPTGSMSGTIRFSNNAGVFGAHVFADSTTASLPFPSTIRKSPIGTLTRVDGSYTITGLPSGSYTVTVEPLDLPATNDDVSGYPSAFGQPAVQTNFTTRQR